MADDATGSYVGTAASNDLAEVRSGGADDV
jgi:hypothetical protein